MKNFNLYEKYVITDLMRRNPTMTLDHAVQVVINQCEGDETQLSEGIKQYRELKLKNEYR